MCACHLLSGSAFFRSFGLAGLAIQQQGDYKAGDTGRHQFRGMDEEAAGYHEVRSHKSDSRDSEKKSEAFLVAWGEHGRLPCAARYDIQSSGLRINLNGD
jgi:hypothetical protein